MGGDTLSGCLRRNSPVHGERPRSVGTAPRFRATRNVLSPHPLSLSCAESYYVDVDMANAHPQLLLDLIVEKSPNSPTQALGRYCANIPLGRAISEYAGFSIEDGKRGRLRKYSTDPAHSANFPLDATVSRTLLPRANPKLYPYTLGRYGGAYPWF